MQLPLNRVHLVDCSIRRYIADLEERLEIVEKQLTLHGSYLDQHGGLTNFNDGLRSFPSASIEAHQSQDHDSLTIHGDEQVISVDSREV